VSLASAAISAVHSPNTRAAASHPASPTCDADMLPVRGKRKVVQVSTGVLMYALAVPGAEEPGEGSR
jgi:hypothetical protein